VQRCTAPCNHIVNGPPINLLGHVEPRQAVPASEARCAGHAIGTEAPLRRDRRPETFKRCGRALCIRLRLVADRRQFRDPILERGIGGVDHPVLNCLVEPLQFRFSLGEALAEFTDVSTPTVIPFLPVLSLLFVGGLQLINAAVPPDHRGGVLSAPNLLGYFFPGSTT